MNNDIETPLLQADDTTSGDEVSSLSTTRATTNTNSVHHPLNLANDNDVEFESHFTLRIPTSTVHFRGSTLRVIDTDQDQIILQETTHNYNSHVSTGDGDYDNKHIMNKVVVKRLSPTSYSNRFLRIGYTLITILLLGFLFVFSLQVLLFLFIALPVDGGYTSIGSLDTVGIVSTLLSFPIMLHGLSSLMAMGSAFVVDTYNGAALFRSTLFEIYYMCVFIIVPMLTFAFALMTGNEQPWRFTAASWAICIAITFTVWGCAVTYKQALACFWLVEHYYLNNEVDGDESTVDTSNVKQQRKTTCKQDKEAHLMSSELRYLLTIAHKAILFTQTARYSGTRDERYNYHTKEGKDLASSRLNVQAPLEISRGIYSRITSLLVRTKLFKDIEPTRCYTSDEVRDIVPYMTKNNWSMQKMWCSGDNRHQVVVASGPSALTRDQVKWSALCTLTSSIVVILLILGCLVWLGMGVAIYIIVAILGLLCCAVPIIKNGLDTVKMYESIVETSNNSNEEDDGANLLSVWETYRITKPSTWYIYTRIFTEIVFFFLWPFIALLEKKNYPIAILFLLLSTFTFIWRYFSALDVLSTLGSITDVRDKTVTHRQQYRLSEVISRVIDKSSRKFWTWIYVVFFFVMLLLTISANNNADTIEPDKRYDYNTTGVERPPILLVDDFYYAGVDNTLSYPTCKLTKGFEFEPGDKATSLSDYSFLSALAYEKVSVVNYTMTEWFGQDTIVDEEEFVSQYREESGTDISPVYFKLFSFPSYPGYAVMSIRGSETSMDWISNMQLWSAAGLAQLVKWITPFGWVFDPIIPDLINIVSKITTRSINEVSYYKTTTRFVNDVMNGYGEDSGKDFSDMHITGASLGGGLAIITAGQTNAYAVAISGLGATLSRLSYDPPIKKDKLDAQTFNFIPERDYIARIGGRAQQFQNGNCIAPVNDLFGCHSMWRSVCEINYRCGSGNRPVACRCVQQFGYPEPLQNGTRTFAEACQEANQTWYELFPPTL